MNRDLLLVVNNEIIVELTLYLNVHFIQKDAILIVELTDLNTKQAYTKTSLSHCRELINRRCMIASLELKSYKSVQ